MTTKLGTAINNNYNNGSMSLSSRVASANEGDDNFFSGDINTLVQLISAVIQLNSPRQITNLYGGAPLNISSDVTLTYPFPSIINANTNNGDIRIHFPKFDATKLEPSQPILINNIGSDPNYSVTPYNAVGNQFGGAIHYGSSGIVAISAIGSNPNGSDDAITQVNLMNDSVTLDYLKLSGGTMLAAIINYTNTPTNPNELVSKSYVDSQVAASQAGFTPKASCYAAATSNIAGAYNNGSLGVGATLTLTATGIFATDGTTPPLNSRIFLSNQTDQKQNGIYVLSNTGSGSTVAVLTRASDYDNSPSGEVINGTWTFIQNGTTYGGTSWYLSTTGTITIGTTPLAFSPLNNLIAGTGLTKPYPNTFALANLLANAFSSNDGSKTFDLSVNQQGQIETITQLAIAIASSQITDSTSVGRALLTAADAATARSNIGAADKTLTINPQTGSTYTLQASDNGKYLTFSVACTVTIPALFQGFNCQFEQLGVTANHVTFVNGAGMTLNSANAALKTRDQYSVAAFVQKTSALGTIFGDVTQ